MKTIIPVLFTFLFMQQVFAQQSLQPDPAARRYPEALAKEILRLISVDSGYTFNKDAFLDLFTPGAQMALIMQDEQGVGRFHTFSAEDFAAIAGNHRPGAFREIELAVSADEFNGLAQVWQAFEVWQQDQGYYARGINSYQMVYAEGRWSIASIIWTNETENAILPVTEEGE
jgi:hypothetical protein